MKGIDTFLQNEIEYHDDISLIKDVRNIILENNPNIEIAELRYDEDDENLF
ncbi:hypothetical protein [Treponema sp.]|uniref:hypothetical protein n=1 Tax=Treponema sp. TaxID=166 RepID=UPI00388F7420